MFANPIIRRYRFSQLRAQQVWVFGALYVCIVLLIVFINSSIYRYGEAYVSLEHLYRSLFVQFAILELFLLWLLCPANCSNVVSREIADKSFDFFRMLPLRAGTKAVGILIGRNLFCLLIAMINLALCLMCAFAGQLSTPLLVQMLVVLGTLTLTLNLLALLFSLLTFKKTKSTSIPVLLVIGLFAFGPVMGSLFQAVGDQSLETNTAPFFTLDVPILYLAAGCAAFIAVWAYIGILRRFTREYEALYNRTGAILFMLTYMAVVSGFFYTHLFGDEPQDVVRGFWIVGLLPVGIVPFFSLRSFDRYLEISRAAGRRKGLLLRLAVNSNITAGVVLFAIWLGFAAAAVWTAQADMMELMWMAMMTFSSLLVILALLETYVMWQPRNEKIGYLLGFLGILYVVLPLILASIFEFEYLVLFSPVAKPGIFDSDYMILDLLIPVFFDLGCLLGLGLLIGKRYYDLAAIREQMHTPQQDGVLLIDYGQTPAEPEPKQG